VYRSTYSVKEIAVLRQPGPGRCNVPTAPVQALSVFDAESTIGITVGIAYIAVKGALSEQRETLRYYIAEDGDPLEPPSDMHYLGRTPKGVHVWTNLPRAE